MRVSSAWRRQRRQDAENPVLVAALTLASALILVCRKRDHLLLAPAASAPHLSCSVQRGRWGMGGGGASCAQRVTRETIASPSKFKAHLRCVPRTSCASRADSGTGLRRMCGDTASAGVQPCAGESPLAHAAALGRDRWSEGPPPLRTLRWGSSCPSEKRALLADGATPQASTSRRRGEPAAVSDSRGSGRKPSPTGRRTPRPAALRIAHVFAQHVAMQRAARYPAQK